MTKRPSPELIGLVAALARQAAQEDHEADIASARAAQKKKMESKGSPPGMEWLFKEWREMVALYSRQLEMLEDGQLSTHSNGRDTTQETIASVRRWKEELEDLLVRHSIRPETR